MKKIIVALAAVLLLTGCSGVGIIASSDPRVKVGQAEEMQRQGRYGRAKQLLDEANAIVQQQGDERGMAEVYRGYGLFYRDGGEDDMILVRPGVQLPLTAAGSVKAQEYFTRSAALFEKLKIYDRLSNVHFLMAQVFYRMNDKPAACKALDESLAANRQAVAAHPDQKIALMPGIDSFDAGIARAKSEVGCPAA
jgi:tetratricopeptide (TPR) repeat protein